MNFTQYRPLALRTAKRFPTDHSLDLQHALMGMSTESGELIDAYKKHLIYGRNLDAVNILEEAGDWAWYLNLLMEVTEAPVGYMESLMVAVYAEPVPDTNDVTDLDALNTLSNNTARIWTGTASGKYDKVLENNIPSAVAALNILLTRNGFTWEQALERNIDKLAARYGDKYTDLAAIKRDLEVERAILEAKDQTVQ